MLSIVKVLYGDDSALDVSLSSDRAGLKLYRPVHKQRRSIPTVLCHMYHITSIYVGCENRRGETITQRVNGYFLRRSGMLKSMYCFIF